MSTTAQYIKGAALFFVGTLAFALPWAQLSIPAPPELQAYVYLGHDAGGVGAVWLDHGTLRCAGLEAYGYPGPWADQGKGC